jgi:hypothetical protein
MLIKVSGPRAYMAESYSDWSGSPKLIHTTHLVLHISTLRTSSRCHLTIMVFRNLPIPSATRPPHEAIGPTTFYGRDDSGYPLPTYPPSKNPLRVRVCNIKLFMGI